jgi:hypothetical protein
VSHPNRCVHSHIYASLFCVVFALCRSVLMAASSSHRHHHHQIPDELWMAIVDWADYPAVARTCKRLYRLVRFRSLRCYVDPWSMARQTPPLVRWGHRVHSLSLDFDRRCTEAAELARGVLSFCPCVEWLTLNLAESSHVL